MGFGWQGGVGADLSRKRVRLTALRFLFESNSKKDEV